VTDPGAPAAEALSRLSHGLRSPLALIAGYADLLELRQDAETLSEAPQRIKEAAADLTRVVDDLLTVYAIDAKVLYLAPEPVQAGTLADEEPLPWHEIAGRSSRSRPTMGAATRSS
jgi:signal transduction histidine kinase